MLKTAVSRKADCGFMYPLWLTRVQSAAPADAAGSRGDRSAALMRSTAVHQFLSLQPVAPDLVAVKRDLHKGIGTGEIVHKSTPYSAVR